ncbi:unnamed protein product, partial [Brenthis ino]
MFQKQTFGSTNTGFGSLNTSTTSPFGGFKLNTGTSAFGAAPAFGANANPQPATGGGLFGSPNTSGGLFGSNPTTSTFGQSSGFGFGASTSSGGLFNNSSGGGLFGNNQNNTAFGAKPATGFGFAGTTNTATTGGLFGSAPSTSTGLFGQQNNTISSGGLFGGTSGGFGQTQATGTAHVKYNPVVGTDVVVKSGTSQNMNIKHHCITCMKEYEGKSLEELRLEDYLAGRKGQTSGGMFGFQQPAENKPLFGGSTFGQPATTSTPTLFGGNIGSTPAFGQTNTFSFGSNTQSNTNTTGLFGANKPAFGTTSTTGTGLFGATTTQAPTFGSTNTFGFGANTQNQNTGGLFGAKPATSAFGTTPASTGFGGFGSGGLFGAKPQQTTAPTFGSTAPTFGATTGFGTNTTGSGLFGGGTFGKPATTQPSFGFNAQPTLGLGTGLGTSFQAKPAAPAFGSLGAGSLFSQPAQNNTFRTGLDSGLGGGGLFGNTSALGGGSLGGLGQMNANNASFTGNLSGASAGGNVHEQILTLAARPYGDTPLFKDLVPDASSSTEDILKATNPAAVRAVLDAGAYRVASPPARLALRPRPLASAGDKKSLFDGLEEYDASLECKLSLKPSRKRLVLRPRDLSPADNVDDNNRSLEDSRQEATNTQEDRQTERNDFVSLRDENRAVKDVNNVNNVDSNSDRHGNWPTSSKQSWSEKEKSMDGESTPRLYPDLDTELSAQISERRRRASWLTTKPLRKPLDSNPDSVENSVRELGVRTHRLSEDKENIDTLSVSEDESAAGARAPPHPAGVKLTRPGYYTIPSLEEITNYLRPDGSCVVPHLTIGRKNYGNVFFDCEIDVAGMDLDALVHFLNKEVIIYPDDENKPPVGAGLNRRAVVTLERVWPRDKTERRPVTEPDRLLKMDYEGKLRRICDKYDTKFIEYRPLTGSWVFRVEHFSKYGLSDSDEEDDTPDVLKRQIVNQSIQKSAAPVQKPLIATPTSTPLGSLSGVAVNGSGPMLGGLGGLGGLGAVGGMGGLGGVGGSPCGELFNMQQSSLNLLSGSKVFDMDTTDDNADAPSLYQEHRAFGVKSPTSELARLEHRQSHHVQVMKASLYNDTEMDDDISVSTGDQLVPHASVAAPLPPEAAPAGREDLEMVPVMLTEEAIMRPLYIQPHTIVLQFHKKVPPFKQTIAGRLNAACLADMSVSRARHSRAGFGPGGALVFVSTYNCVNDLPKTANLSELGHYVRGRSEDDWSESVVTRMCIGRTGDSTQNILSRQLESLLEFSTAVQTQGACDRLVVRQSPGERRALLRRLLDDARDAGGDTSFGVSGEYCLQVWKLCDALWGADLDNDGVPGTDEQSIVNRHNRLLEWFKDAVSQITDKKLAEPREAEKEDEKDFHSARVLTLLLGGRVVEACKLCRDSGDLNMAALLAQCAGDPAFKSLIYRQMNTWRECGALSLMAENRIGALNLLSTAGKAPNAHWLQTLHAVARYTTPQIPTLEQIIRTYESYFSSSDEEVDLTTLPDDEMGMQFPTPPYLEEYSWTMNGKYRRVLDLRYELLRARAFHARPRLSPACYTPDPFDHALSFMLGCWLGAPSPASITGAAEQLCARGDWHLALQVLAYHPDDLVRGHLMREVVSRHAPARAQSPGAQRRLALARRLRVPEAWLLAAQAHRAKYEHKPALEVEYLVGAEQWNEAHKVLLDELLPEAVLSDNMQSIKHTLEALSAAAARQRVDGWERGGQALYHYLHVCDEIRGLVVAAPRGAPALAARLEALRPALAAACRALRGLTATSPVSARVAAARAEMGARLLQLALAGGEPPPHLAALLRALRLPPDCAARAQDKITTDLAEQASELCLESSQSSPISSHRTAVKS